MNSKKIAIVGGGPAGLIAACAAADAVEENQAKESVSIFLFEKMDSCGKKLLLTGNGRCNVTHAGSVSDHIAQYFENGRFLYSALTAFSSDDLTAFFAARKVPFKTEEDGRVFPKSNRASDILLALTRYAKEKGVQFMMNEAVLDVQKDDKQPVEYGKNRNTDSEQTLDSERERIFCLQTTQQIFHADRIIVCTGGLSIPDTGSTGDGFRIASSLGHHVERQRPALCPIHIKMDCFDEKSTESSSNLEITSDHGVDCELYKKDRLKQRVGIETLQGVTIGDIGLSLYNGKCLLKKERGSLLFAHFGVTGPAVFRISRELPVQDELYRDGLIRMRLDFTPDKTQDQLVEILMERLVNSPNKLISGAWRGLWSEAVLYFLLEKGRIDLKKYSREISKKQVRFFVETLKNMEFQIERKPDYKLAMVTRGGVKLSEISPKTMESKKCSGMYFAGETMNIDGDTGGFNLQAAFSTGVVAGKNAGVSLCCN